VVGGAFGKYELEGGCLEVLVENVKETDNLEDSDIDDTL
jgi:hypothetical protein